jgi:hypothetical protein
VKIFKYGLSIGEEVRLLLPFEARILSVQAHGGIPCLWAVVDPEAPMTERLFCWRATGEELGDAQRGVYVGTVQLHGGRFVVHLFDLGAPP